MDPSTSLPFEECMDYHKQDSLPTNENGYTQSKLISGLWKHEWRTIQFTLVVDDSGVKYVGKEHTIHLKETLEHHYKVTNDWAGTRYIDIALDWDYKRKQVYVSMPRYVAKTLKQFQHIKPRDLMVKNLNY